MKLVVIESPLSGNFNRNIRYARLCMLDSLQRGEAPFASHLLYTQMLDDVVHNQRRLGMEAGFAWGRSGDLRAFYVDLGMSSGMEEGETQAQALGQETERRQLPAQLMRLLDGGAIGATEGAVTDPDTGSESSDLWHGTP
jgi:hypothetical protein